VSGQQPGREANRDRGPLTPDRVSAPSLDVILVPRTLTAGVRGRRDPSVTAYIECLPSGKAGLRGSEESRYAPRRAGPG